MRRKCLPFLATTLLPFMACAQLFQGGRIDQEGFTFEVYGGWGGMDSVEGSVQETRNGGIVSGGVSVDLKELGLEDDFSTFFFGARAYNRWVTFLLDYRSSSLEASGKADREYRLAVDNVLFGGQRYEYLIIPSQTDYDIEANVSWLGLGVRVTPFSINPDGFITFTPWVHLGVQGISADYDVDAGATVRVETTGSPNRTYARRGSADGDAKAVIPEYGIGGEIRFRFHQPEMKGFQIVAEATYKILDFQGAIDSLGIDKKEFEDIDFQYSALEANLYALIPLSEKVDLLAGLYVEQVDVSAVLEADKGSSDPDRDIDLSYTIYGARVGLRF